VKIQTSSRSKTVEEAANLQTVIDFYEIIINQQKWDRISEFVDPGYIQHKPEIADGIPGLLSFMRWVYENSPNHESRLVRALVDGEFVTLHVNVINAVEHANLAVMDIFRLKNGKLIEHWDVARPVPTKGLKNDNTMF